MVLTSIGNNDRLNSLLAADSERKPMTSGHKLAGPLVEEGDYNSTGQVYHTPKTPYRGGSDCGRPNSETRGT